jgi:predicted nucleotidyltransferase
MRITEQQKKEIIENVSAVFGSSSKILLFGSRVDDTKKGGDIDLLVECPGNSDDPYTRMVKAVSLIQRAIGDQKIDMIISDDISIDQRPVVKEALRTGVRLW